MDESPERSGFPRAGLSGDKHDAAVIFHVEEAAGQFFGTFRAKELIGVNRFFKGHAGEVPKYFKHDYSSF